jgi:hypothetical protein
MPERFYEFMSHTQHRRALLFYRTQNAAWLWLGLAAIVSAINWFSNPEAAAKRSAVGRELSGPWDDLWTISTAIGGVLIIYGIWQFRIRSEIVGHLAFAAGVAVNFVAVLVVFGLTSTSIILGAVCIASGARAWFLWKLARGADFS